MKHKWLIAGGLIAAELALCGAMVFASWQGIGAAQSSGLQLRLFQFDTVSAESDEEQRLAVDGPAALLVDTPDGSVRVTAGAGDEIVISTHKTAWGASEAEARAQLETLIVTVTQVENDVTVRVEQPSDVTIAGSERSDVVDFVITVPAETRVTARSGYGDLEVSGARLGADLRGGSGHITVERTDGDVNLRSDFGDISFTESAAGEVAIYSANGAVRLQDVRAESDMSLGSAFGNIRFETGSARVLEVKSDNGKVELLALEVDGPVTVDSAFGDLTLSNVIAGAYDLQSDNGDILLDGAEGRITVDSQFGNVVVQNAEAAVLDLDSSNGAIDFSGSLAGGPHSITSSFGNVSLALPEAVELTLDLKTEFGSIESEFPITVNDVEESSHWRGTVNGGGPELTAHTDNGDITLSILPS